MNMISFVHFVKLLTSIQFATVVASLQVSTSSLPVAFV